MGGSVLNGGDRKKILSGGEPSRIFGRGVGGPCVGAAIEKPHMHHGFRCGGVTHVFRFRLAGPEI